MWKYMLMHVKGVIHCSTNSHGNLRLRKVHIAYEWIISQPLNFDTIFRWNAISGTTHSKTSSKYGKSLIDLRHESYIIFNVAQRAQVLKMQIFIVRHSEAMWQQKLRRTYFIRCYVTWIGRQSIWCRSSSKTRRENNNKLGSFQWKYIMTTSSRNWSYIRVSPSNEMAAVAYATSCTMSNPTKRYEKKNKQNQSHHCE